jgi:hypothetical protein
MFENVACQPPLSGEPCDALAWLCPEDLTLESFAPLDIRATGLTEIEGRDRL